jgi:transglutaminase-like putative cysteine protease
MKIRVGFEMIYDFPQATPLIAVVGTHFTRASDVIVPDHLTSDPSVPITPYRDGFGNWCSRIVAPAGRMRLSADGTVRDSGLPDVIVPSAGQHAVEDLPADTIVYLLGSRYCETDRLSDIAWKLFEKTAPGWARVQAICDFVHNRLRARARDHDGVGSLQRTQRCLPGLRASGHRVLPLHEHPGALLHRLSRRYRYAAALCRRRFCRVV